MLRGAARLVAPFTGWAVVVVVSVATTAGLVARYLTPDGADYLLLTRDVGDHPVRSALFLVLSLAAYAVLFLGSRRLMEEWRDGSPSAPGSGFLARVQGWTDWTYARWWRVSLVLLVVWMPWYLSSFPGQPSPDPANMLTEFVSTRADFAGAPPLAGPDQTAPYIDYPTSSYLMTDGDSLWSDHHPFFLMLAYGSVGSLSIAVFDSLVPALVVLSAASALFTMVAFGRALAILGTLVPGWRPRALALLVLALSPLVALWSMAEHKNQLFCAAFVWWLALLARLVHAREPVGRRWYVETSLVSVAMAVTVQFGWILLLAQAIAMLALKRERVAALLAVGVPALLVHGVIVVLASTGALIPSDPIETKGVQLQVLGLMLNEHPDTLSDQQRDELSRLFDLDAFAASFDPSSSDPLKSTGPLSRKTASFRYRTVQEDDWAPFNGVVLDTAREHPGTFLDALFLKSYRYLDPGDVGTDWYPPWNGAYERSIDGHPVAPLEINEHLRVETRTAAYSCYGSSLCRPTMSHGVRTVIVVVLLAAAVAARRRFAWLWALPFALQLAIAGVSPLSAGGRYVLAFTYGLAVVVLLLAVDDRSPGRAGAPGPPGRPNRAKT